MNSNFVSKLTTRRKMLMLGSGLAGSALLSEILAFGLSAATGSWQQSQQTAAPISNARGANEGASGFDSGPNAKASRQHLHAVRAGRKHDRPDRVRGQSSGGFELCHSRTSRNGDAVSYRRQAVKAPDQNALAGSAQCLAQADADSVIVPGRGPCRQ